MDKRNSLKGEITIRKSGYEETTIKGAVGYTLPGKPNEALSMMTQQNDRQIANETMFIPFPEIRNVIVTFMRPYPALQKDYSEILASEYGKNKILEKLDISINEKIAKAYHQKLKLEKILKCFQKSQKLKNTVNELKRTLRENADDDLRQKVKKIQSQADGRKFQARGNEELIKEIQTRKNQMIIEQFQTHYSQYEKKNNDFIRLNFAYSEIKEFTKEMQKIIPIIWRYEEIPESKEEIRSENFIEYFKLKIKQQKQPLIKFIQECEVWLQFFRNKVKTESWVDVEDSQNLKSYQNELKELNLSYDRCEQNIRKEVYQKLKEISKLDQDIVRNIQSQITSNMRSYQRFVQTYTDIKQVCNTKNKWKEFYRIIAEQEKKLSNHMRQLYFIYQFRLNCGLVVYYKPTEEFEDFERALNNRVYVELIFGQRIGPLRNAIRFINEEHNLMYKRACEDSRSGARLRKDEVQRKLMQFQKNLEELQRQRENLQTGNQNHFDYLTHLIVSLNRLMTLAR